jgi:class 3 adenylate cyclase
MNLVELGKRIRELREKRWLKQRDIANALQISAQAVSKWERGENAPDIAVLLDLSKLLGVSVDALLGRREKEDDTFPATVFCTSLNNFARRSAKMPPREIARWANGVFHLVTEAVVAHEGVPVKYVGDGFLGFFSGPNHAKRAVAAALDAKTAVQSPDLVIVLHSGDIYLGSVGHGEYARADIIGDTVNTAFLIMPWVAEKLPDGIGLTQSVADLVPGISLSAPKRAGVRGIGKSVMVYTPNVRARGGYAR